MQRKDLVESSTIDDVLEQLQSYPKEELYRFIVDGRLHAQENGWLGYEERQPGSLKAAFNGLGYALTNLSDTQLTITYLQELHKICTTNVENLQFNEGQPGILRSHPVRDVVGYLLEPTRVTVEGLTALLDRMESQSEYPQYHSMWLLRVKGANEQGFMVPDMNGSFYHDTLPTARSDFDVTTNHGLACALMPFVADKKYNYLAPRAGEVFTKELNSLIDGYNKSIAETQNADEKLKIIVNLIYELEHLHPFFDGNTRTLSICLLNRLLIQNGFLPLIQEDPNLYAEGWTKEQLFNETVKSMQNTKDILAGKKDSFGFCSAEIPATPQVYDDIISGFLAGLAIEMEKRQLSVQTKNIDCEKEGEKEYSPTGNAKNLRALKDELKVNSDGNQQSVSVSQVSIFKNVSSSQVVTDIDHSPIKLIKSNKSCSLQ